MSPVKRPDLSPTSTIHCWEYGSGPKPEGCTFLSTICVHVTQLPVGINWEDSPSVKEDDCQLKWCTKDVGAVTATAALWVRLLLFDCNALHHLCWRSTWPFSWVMSRCGLQVRWVWNKQAKVLVLHDPYIWVGLQNSQTACPWTVFTHPWQFGLAGFGLILLEPTCGKSHLEIIPKHHTAQNRGLTFNMWPRWELNSWPGAC